MADIKAAPQPAQAQTAAQPAQGKKTETGPLGALKDRVSSIIKAGPGQLDIGLVNFGLIGIIAVLIVFFAFRTSSAWRELQKELAREYTVSSAGKEEPGFAEIPTMKGVSYYIGKLSGRDIFRRQAKEDALLSEPVFSTKMADMTADLKLVGISMSADPDAMIEDTKLEKTFFVKTGSMIGDLRVESITKDKIVLKYNKELFELK